MADGAAGDGQQPSRLRRMASAVMNKSAEVARLTKRGGKRAYRTTLSVLRYSGRTGDKLVQYVLRMRVLGAALKPRWMMLWIALLIPVVLRFGLGSVRMVLYASSLAWVIAQFFMILMSIYIAKRWCVAGPDAFISLRSLLTSVLVGSNRVFVPRDKQTGKRQGDGDMAWDEHVVMVRRNAEAKGWRRFKPPQVRLFYGESRVPLFSGVKYPHWVGCSLGPAGRFYVVHVWQSVLYHAA